MRHWSAYHPMKQKSLTKILQQTSSASGAVIGEPARLSSLIVRVPGKASNKRRIPCPPMFEPEYALKLE